MSRIIREKGSLFLVFLFFFLLTEAITFRWVGFTTFSQFLYIDIIMALIIGSIAILFRSNVVSLVIYSFIYGIVIALFMINVTMYDIYYDLFSLQQLQLINEAATVFNFAFLSIPSIIISVILCLLFLTINILLVIYFKKHPQKVDRFHLKTVFMFVVINMCAITLFASGIPSVSEYKSQSNITTFKRASLEKYGTLGYYAKEAEDIILREYNLTDDGDNNETPSNIVYADQTDYFGLLEGMNVITIMIESGQPFGISEVLTPHLYDLTQEGLYFPNNYSENKTNISEVAAITGNYPSINFLPGSYDYEMPFAVPNILADTYETMYFHDNVPSFYSRGALLPQLGFENIYLHDDLYPGEDIWTWNGDYTLDSETIEKILPILTSSGEPFYAFWSTLSTHGPYNCGRNNIISFAEKNYFARIDAAEDAGLWTNVLANGEATDASKIRYYQAAMMNLDDAVGRLLEELENNNMLDNTVIILYGDHNVYYHDLSTKMYADSGNEYYNMEMYHTFFCIYNKTLTQAYLENTGSDSTSIEDFTSPYSIVPTLLDLLGYSYDKNIYLGDSIFSGKMQVFYSHKLSGLFNNIIYSNDGIDIDYSSISVDDDYIDSFQEACEELIVRLEYVNYAYYSTQTNRD
ncbi:MAG TPA: LTA synthase family protein [Bacillota bacterium]|nr:LTA synthase family protein [Bacillota bacterium]HPJ85591.1 LTA synthase family protein [Bacillota bacterium]HPQ61457.1 LTA synthase family protein [Bacillota bacterium]HRX92235.1 LTA synthase family protein [Candidatus Izemoplasmatales bacterium]